MRRGGLLATLVALVAAVGLSACATETPVPVRIQNETSVPVGLYVNGTWVGTYPSGADTTVQVDRPIEQPWIVELRSPTDAVLLTLNPSPGTLADARSGRYGVGESLGLPCGVLTALVGSLGADEALAPAESVAPGPCP